MNNPLEQVFRACALLLGAVIVLNLAVAYLQPILPWIIGGVALALGTWSVIALVRWWRSRW